MKHPIQLSYLTNMRKQTKVFLLIINLIIVLFLFSQELYARALHFIAYGRHPQGYEDKRKTPGKTQYDSQRYTGE